MTSAWRATTFGRLTRAELKSVWSPLLQSSNWAKGRKQSCIRFCCVELDLVSHWKCCIYDYIDVSIRQSRRRWRFYQSRLLFSMRLDCGFSATDCSTLALNHSSRLRIHSQTYSLFIHSWSTDKLMHYVCAISSLTRCTFQGRSFWTLLSILFRGSRQILIESLIFAGHHIMSYYLCVYLSGTLRHLNSFKGYHTDHFFASFLKIKAGLQCNQPARLLSEENKH